MIELLFWIISQAATVLGIAIFAKYIPKQRLTSDPGGVVVIATVREHWPNADLFLTGIGAQQHCRIRLILVGPDRVDDPTWLQNVSDGCYGINIQVLRVATVKTEGQKVHKLRTALRHLEPNDRYIVFLDTDIDPPTNLIGRLVFPLATKKSRISTGYRLSLPQALWSLGSLIAAVDLQIATLPRPPKGTLAWGGAMAITRDVCEELDLQSRWQNCLSDDLTLARLASAAGITIRPVRDLLLPSSIDGHDAWAFGVRQYRHLVCNLPRLWGVALAINLIQAVAWTLVLMSGNWMAVLIGYLAAWMRVGLRLSIARGIVAKSNWRAFHRVLLWDAFAPFLIVYCHLAIIVVGGCSRVIRWGGFAYTMQRGHVIDVREI